MSFSFRHSAGFGKRVEYNLIGKMLMEGLDVYVPLVDDHGVDCVIKKEDRTFIEVQIKARSMRSNSETELCFRQLPMNRRKTSTSYFILRELKTMMVLKEQCG